MKWLAFILKRGNLCTLLFVLGTAFGEGEIFNFESPEQTQKMAQKDASYELVKTGSGVRLRVRFGTNSPSPSIYFRNPSGWNFSGKKTLTVPIWNIENESVTVWCRVDSQPRQGGPLLSKTFKVFVEGERHNTLRVDLLPISSATTVTSADFFGMRGGPYNGIPMHLENVVEVIVFLNKPARPFRLEIGCPAVEEGSGSALLFEKPFPFVDGFGQNMYQNWPGKIKNPADLKTRLVNELGDLSSHPTPSNWGRWGGWQGGPLLHASGYFRTEKVGSRWWLVDPDGRLFFSHGINFVNFGSWTAVDGREKWFDSLPDGALASNLYRTVTSGHVGYHYFGKTVRAVNFFMANLVAKYPGDFREAFVNQTIRRLGSWGINTMATWSDPDMLSRKKYPYTVLVNTDAPKIEGSSGHWGKFIDVFHPDFKNRFSQTLRAHPSVGDPWCLGFFVDNEMSWGNETGLALAVLASGANQPAKKIFVDSLQSKHVTIEGLNAAWGSDFQSWEDLRSRAVKPDEKKAWSDLTNFTSQIADTYFKGIREVFREVAPRQLYLGCRFAWANPIAIAASGRHCDVVSFNVYKRSPLEKGDQFSMAGDKPIMVGEFHFGALDRGLFHTGLVAVKNQAERAQAYGQYMTDALDSSNIIGTHWFQYIDQPLTGRWLDGENYQVGFLDVCDNPYPETIEVCRKIGVSLYGPRK